MNTRIALLATACAFALVACGDKSPDAPADTAAAPDASEAAPDASGPVDTAPTMPADTAPADTTAAPAPAATAPGSDKPAATVANCATEIEGTDAMQYSVGSIVVPASCSEFKITLKHTGTMPVAAMGHNVVVTKAADMQAVAAEGMGAGAAASYVKAGDARVIAHTDLVGGGQTTSVSFPVDKIKDGGPYEFFCSFPGHSALMKGTISVE